MAGRTYWVGTACLLVVTCAGCVSPTAPTPFGGAAGGTITAGSACGASGFQLCGATATGAAVLACAAGVWQPVAVCAADEVCVVGSDGPICQKVGDTWAAQGDVTDAGIGDGQAVAADAETSAQTGGDGTVAEPACKKPADCDDGDACTSDICTAAQVCQHVKLASCGTSALPCGSLSDCAGAGVCDTSRNVCVECLVPADCGVGQRCVEQICVQSAACKSDVECKAVGGICDLTAGVCVPCLKNADCGPGQRCTPKGCEVAKPCVSSKDCPAVCDAGTGTCVLCVKHADCPTGQWCTPWQQCKPVVCTGPACSGETAWSCKTSGDGYADGTSCSDGNPCTTDQCSAGKCLQAAASNQMPCDDGDLCTTDDSCMSGECLGKTTDCDDGNPCTIDDCSPKGKCAHIPAEPKTPCDGLHVCDALGACVVCIDPLKSGKTCDQCVDPSKTGPLCDKCKQAGLSGPACQCGDGKCSVGETVGNCAADCAPACTLPADMPQSVARVVTLAIGKKDDGCDLVDASGKLAQDGKPDNSVALLAALGNGAIQDKLNKNELNLLFTTEGYTDWGVPFKLGLVQAALLNGGPTCAPPAQACSYVAGAAEFNQSSAGNTCPPASQLGSAMMYPNNKLLASGNKDGILFGLPLMGLTLQLKIRSPSLSATATLTSSMEPTSACQLIQKFDSTLSQCNCEKEPTSPKCTYLDFATQKAQQCCAASSTGKKVNTMTSGKICGYIPESDFKAAMAAVPPEQQPAGGIEVYLSLIPPDIDSDGDGKKDARSIALLFSAAPGSLAAIAP